MRYIKIPRITIHYVYYHYALTYSYKCGRVEGPEWTAKHFLGDESESGDVNQLGLLVLAMAKLAAN